MTVHERGMKVLGNADVHGDAAHANRNSCKYGQCLNHRHDIDVVHTVVVSDLHVVVKHSHCPCNNLSKLQFSRKPFIKLQQSPGRSPPR